MGLIIKLLAERLAPAEMLYSVKPNCLEVNRFPATTKAPSSWQVVWVVARDEPSHYVVHLLLRPQQRYKAERVDA
ncbi:hypothetical protein Aspvir_010182 [Aspergillus viridinutans]|uniref:Uncharacterized protein n=1 Tax=Aspergillus viridinutans TaxID=75553 RepID=A0A9P3C1J0_ASPVI|nr:uncharacterized protein Aspvir_010182 [Aspergillus viridinutans]GIK06064.1 hypothetical protein Aspvir_010182 [Aspergillus viridinutans]